MLKVDIQHLLPEQYRPFPLEDVRGSMIDRFKQVVARHADDIAIEDADAKCTYREVDERSNRIANWILDRLGNGAEPVVLLYDRAVADLFIVQIAVLKAGKFFSCLDAKVGSERLLKILSSLAPRLVFCDSHTEGMVRALILELGGIDAVALANADVGRVDSNPTISVAPDDLAYVTYTSGSTGLPQGVMVSHESLLHAVMNHTNNMHLMSEDRVAQMCALDSGGFAGETFTALLNGATLLPYSIRNNGAPRSARWLLDKRVTMLTCVPTVFRLLGDAVAADTRFPNMRVVRLSGDRVRSSDVALYKRRFSDTCLLRVMLAASECQAITQFWIDKTYEPQGETIPAGFSLEGMDVFVVDDDMSRLAPMERGEIVVRSQYLSAGYWKNVALTAERFLDVGAGKEQRMYLTRDCGYFDEHGCLVHIGRKDARVKVYGKTVSLTDVEEAVLLVPGIQEAVVVAVSGAQETTLVAFVVADGGAEVDEIALRRTLLSRLSPQDVPKNYVRLQTMPLTKNGKVDRLRLRAFAEGDVFARQAGESVTRGVAPRLEAPPPDV